MLKVSDVAARLGVSGSTVKSIPPEQLAVSFTPRGHRRYREEDVAHYEELCRLPKWICVEAPISNERELAWFEGFCTEILASSEGVSIPEALKLLTRSGVLLYLRKHYSVLHTQGEAFILGDIYELFDKKGIAYSAGSIAL